MNHQIVEELINPANSKILLGLDRIKTMLSLLDNPQNCYKVIHITGTNGKGSTATFIESGLIHAGYKVGKYSSPYIDRINETISLKGNFIADDDLEKAFEYIKTIQNQHSIELSQFELLTVIMFYYFKEQLIDYLVLEVGMGGENDATNVIDKPVCVVITNIALEHTNWFGNSLAQIASEKSGIIKSSLCPVIIADTSAELRLAVSAKSSKIINVLEKYSFRVELDFINFRTNLAFNEDISKSKDILKTTKVQAIESKEYCYSLSLFGKFQAYNFLCAVEVFYLLGIADSSIQFAAENTIWNARLQLIAKNPNILVDATHNEAGSRALYETLSDNYFRCDVVIITSILADKNIKAMLDYFSKIASTIVFTSITNTPRGLSADELYQNVLETELNTNTQIHAIENPHDALEFAKKFNKKLILITGSLYLLKYYQNISSSV